MGVKKKGFEPVDYPNPINYWLKRIIFFTNNINDKLYLKQNHSGFSPV